MTPFGSRTWNARSPPSSSVSGIVMTLSACNRASSASPSSTSLYTYVPGKAELIDLMVDTARAATDASAHDPDHAYAFGLARLLDGLAAPIDALPDPAAVSG